MRLRLAYLFTTFPEPSETFLQREVQAMRAQPVDFTLYSLWGGSREWEGLTVLCFEKLSLFSLFWWLPYWTWRKPRAILETCAAMAVHTPRSWLNLLENLLGFAFALTHAHKFEALSERPHLCHGVWATAPAAAALLLERLIGVPYTMGAHAYDVFQHGGDWLLEEKLRHARLIHTTTAATRAELVARGAPPARIALVRRGLEKIPPLAPRRRPGEVLHLLAVGRLVPKKGYMQLLEILRRLRDGGVKFECRIVGDGPEKLPLLGRRRELNLENCVRIEGALPHPAVAVLQADWADCFLFTGLVAPDGDRDGLPNVIPEAMATGVPVLTTPVAGTTEAVVHGQTGLVIAPDDFAGWREGIIRATRDLSFSNKLRAGAHTWVAENFDAQRNATLLAEAVRHAVMGSRV